MRAIELPWPPTANHLTMTVGKRRVKTKKHRDYCESVRYCVLAQRIKPFGDDRLNVTIEAFPPDRRRRDIDNLFKAVLDGLGYAGVYDDDSQIDHLSITRLGIVRGGSVFVTVSKRDAEG